MSPLDIAATGFPTRRNPPRLTVADMGLRYATSDDMPFLQLLYRSFRTDELAGIRWPTEQKHAFLEQQFIFQHRHYMAAFPEAEFLIIELDGMPIGRLYLNFSPEHWLIVDIGLIPEWRSKGRGGALLSAIQREATRSGVQALTLHVEHHNIAAQALYRRLGFFDVESGSSHIRMEWPCSIVSNATQR
ncbi:GNAT family N-acetyltransferase [Ensifer adhaerens]|uniref:GNAT family N-acetyltransferase n=1 Tax=Ensifer adhaerens TaxID=106592 RepID=UPI000DC544DD|nr:GNAT family N-acetyltransferase [Ensifer adhaerens]RAS01909.1 ribosomal protein S18 acetylase RimI-like enzyme [Ensifer adhaerens]